MKILLLLLGLLGVGVFVFLRLRGNASSEPNGRLPDGSQRGMETSEPPDSIRPRTDSLDSVAAAMTRDLRSQALTAPLELGDAVGQDEPFLVLMEIGYPDAFATLLTTSEGDASLYISTGGGVIGGIGHESVRTAAVAFVAEVSKHRSRFRRTSDTPGPGPGQVTFYIRTPSAIYRAECVESALVDESDDLSSLFYAGQDVLTQLRLITQESGGF